MTNGRPVCFPRFSPPSLPRPTPSYNRTLPTQRANSLLTKFPRIHSVCFRMSLDLLYYIWIPNACMSSETQSTTPTSIPCALVCMCLCDCIQLPYTEDEHTRETHCVASWDFRIWCRLRRNALLVHSRRKKEDEKSGEANNGPARLGFQPLSGSMRFQRTN